MKYRYIYLSLLPLLVAACSEESMKIDGPADDTRNEIKLRAEIDQVNISRANDSGFADGDVIGVYAVNFDNGQPGTLSPSGNNADNVDFRYDAESFSWSGSKSIFFSDPKTPVDVYGYYPYASEISDPQSYPFSVAYNQSGESDANKLSAYEASDFLWAKSAGVTASTPVVTLYFKHILSSVSITLIEGTGFGKNEWATLEKSVLVSGTRRDATINLATGEVKAIGEKDGRNIVANSNRHDFRAIVIPQTVPAGETLLAVTVDNRTYRFTKSTNMVYMPTKQHKFTIEVNKNEATGDFEFSLIDEAITAWESDLTSHNGQAKEYIIVNTPEFGGLQSVISEMGLDPGELVNLKLAGKMNSADFQYIRSKMSKLEAINLQDVIVFDDTYYGQKYQNTIPRQAFINLFTLKTCVFPKKLEGIGPMAFVGTSLSGSLEIPEGVTIIHELAFGNPNNENAGGSTIPGWQILHHNNLTGTLSLPSTLKIIEKEAFQGCDFSGELLLPEGLEQIQERAFSNCKYFTGDLHLPETVDILGSEAFSGMTGLNGWIYLPSKLQKLEGLNNLNVNGIDWPDNLVELGYRAFLGFNSPIDLKIPESVTTIGGQCFSSSKIKHVILPPNITNIPDGCFGYCSELIDTITVPEGVETIEESAFRNCSKLEAIVLPSTLLRIGQYAFGACFNMNYIRCDAIEPPTLIDSFWGIEKDNFTIEVPEQSVEAYRQAPGWSEFKRISAYRNFVARPSKYDVLNKGGRREIILNADADWEMTSCPSWCHIDKTSGSKKTTLTLTVDAMAKGSSDRTGKITFKLKDKEEHLTHINVAQYDYEYDEDQYLTLQSATKGKGINLAFIGDGYDAVDIASGKYLEDMKREMEYFFGVEPYTTYRDYFNVYTAFALSEDSGVENINRWRNTKFKVTTGDGCSKDGQRLNADWMSALDYCGENIPPTVSGPNPQIGCILVANTNIYEGKTYIGESFCAVVTLSEDAYPYDARGVIQHEAGGHGIGWLGDEYIYHSAFIQKCGCSCCGHVEELTADHTSGFGLNVSLNGKYKEVPWSHLIFNPNYGDIVDIYEGGYFHSRGVYRSEYNSCMNNNVPYFSTWSRQLIVQRIMKLAGEEFSLEKFYANDSRALGPDFTSTGRSGTAEVSAPRRYGNPPVFIKNYKFGKKGGRR